MLNPEKILAQIEVRNKELLAIREQIDVESIILLPPSPAFQALIEVLIKEINEKFGKVDWKGIFNTLTVGEQYFIKGKAQTSAGSECNKHSRNGKKFITKAAVDGTVVIRVRKRGLK